MDNRKKKQTLSRSGHRTGTHTPGTHSVRSAANKRNTRQPGRSEHISQNRRPSPLTPDSLRTTVPLSGETAPAGGRLTDPGAFRATDSGALRSSGPGTFRPAGPGTLRSAGSEALYPAGPLSAEPYKPSFSYAETLVTDAELEAFLSRAVQDMIPDIGLDDESALNDSSLNSSVSNDSALKYPVLNQGMGKENPENMHPSQAVRTQSAAADHIPETAGSTHEKVPASPMGEDLSGKEKISAAGKKARNITLSRIAASLPDTGSTGASADGFPSSTESSPSSAARVPASSDRGRPSTGNAGNTASQILTGSSIMAADNIKQNRNTRESLFEENRNQLNRVPENNAARISGPEYALPENKKMPGEKPDKGLTVKKVFSALLTLAGAAACVLIVHYFHMRSVGVTPEIGVFSTLAGQALKTDSTEQEDSAPEDEAQDAAAGDDQPSDSADPSASDAQYETDTAGSDQEMSTDRQDQPVSDGGEATGFDPASDPASLYPASQNPVTPVPSAPDQTYSDPAYSDQASQDPASYDPAYVNQEADQEIDPDESDWDSFEEEPEEETEWNTIDEDDPDWNDEDYPDEDMDEEDEDYEE